MEKKTLTSVIAGFAFLAIAIAGALYADKVYVPPEAPPNILYTIKGPVILSDEANPGDLITAPNLGSIFYVNQDRKRVVFPDEQTFASWYADYSDIKTVTKELLESLPLSGYNATIRPGTFLITIPTSPQVWAVGYPNELQWLTDGEEQVISLFGENWTDRLVDIPEYYYANYSDGPDIVGDTVYPNGALLKSTDGSYFLQADEGLIEILEEGFEANHFQDRFAIIIESYDEPIAMIDEYDPTVGSPDKNEQLGKK